MKAKVSLDTQKIKSFFVTHTEKLVFGLFALGFVWFLYGAITQEIYERNGQPMTPNRLTDLNRAADEHIKRQVPDVESLEIDTELPDPAKAVATAETPVKPAEKFVVFNPGVWQPNAKRGEPEYLPIADVRANAGYGAFSSKNGNAKQGAAKGFRWVVLTGLFQAAKQETLYAEKFRNSGTGKRNTDVPTLYIYQDRMPFLVQRRDVTDSVPEGDQGWETLPMLKLLEIERQLSSSSREVVDDGYVQDGLTRPLPPLLAGTWEDDESVAHKPEIKLASASETAAEPEAAPTAEPVEAEPVKDKKDAPLFGPAEGAPEKEPKKADEKVAKKDEGPEPVRLFRFFDYTVEAGRRYQYRVQLALHNPNYGLREIHLSSPNFGKDPYKLSQWSEPTRPIAIPRDNDVLAGPVKPTRGVSEPVANVILHQWDPETGLTALERFELMRGQLANYDAMKVPVDDPTGNNEEPLEISFQTDTVLLDIVGGDTLGKSRIDEPGELLLFDADGRLVVRSEIADVEQYRKDDGTLAKLKGEETRGGKSSRDKDDKQKEDPFSEPGSAKPSGEDDVLGGAARRKKK